MTLDFRSATFRKTYNALDELSKQGQLTPDVAREIVANSGLDIKEFKEANRKFKVFKELPHIKRMIDRGIDPTEPTIIDQIFLIPTRAVGQAISGVFDLGDAAAKASLETETYDTIKKGMDEYTPEVLKETFNAFADPYHGEGIGGTTSEVVGDVGSYFVAGGGLAKLGKLALARPAISPSVGRVLNKIGRKGALAAKGGAYGLAAAGGTTIVEDPRQNAVDYLYAYISGNEEALEKLDQYSNNPESAELSDYFDALIKNIGLQAGLSVGIMGATPIVKSLAQKHKAAIGSKLKSVSTRLDKVTEPVRKSKVGRKASQYLTSRRGTDDLTLARVIEREAAPNAALREAEGFANDLKKSIQDNLSDKIKQNPTYVEDTVDQALKGNTAAKARLRVDSPETADIVDEMNSAVQKLQTELSKSTATSSQLSTTIDNSLGTYMTRSYEVFDNPEYRKEIQKRVAKRMGATNAGKIGDEVVDNAAEFIANQAGKSIDDPYVQETLERLVGVGAADKSAFFDFIEDIANKQVLRNTGKPLFKRKDVPVEIRELFGEIKDPSLNFTKTYEKLATLNAENKFLENMANSLQVKYANRVNDIMAKNPNLTRVQAELRAKEGMIDAGSVGSDALGAIIGRRPLAEGAIKNPLQGVYADEEYIKIMKDGLNPEFNSQILKYFAAAKGLSQKAKTVYNPATHAKNVAGNVAMLGANGMLPAGQSVGTALSSVATNLGKKTNRELAKQMATYDRLGITNSNLGLGEIRKNLGGISKDVDGWLDKTTSGNRVIKVGKKTDEYITNLYQAEDDFFKIVHFEKTKEYLKKAYPNIEEEELLQMAAQRTRDLMPNYNLVPTAIKALRGAPVGDFVSFPAEMTRITKNLGKYSIKDLASGNAELAKAGAKRLGGMTIVAAAPTIGMEASKAIYGIDDDQSNAIEMLGPVYEVNQDKIYLSPLNRDKNGHLGVDYVNLGSWDPFSYLKSMTYNTHDLIMMGTGMDPERTSYEFNKTASAMLDQTIAPFLGPSMITEAALDAMRGRDYSDEPTLDGKLQKGVRMAVDLFDPGFAKWYERRKQYEDSGMTDYYSSIPESSTELEALLGLKTSRADLTAGARFNFNPEFNRIFRAERQMSDVLTSPNQQDSEKVMDEFKDVQRIRLAGFKNIRDLLELYHTLGMDLPEVANDITLDERVPLNQGKIDLLEGAEYNTFIPYMPSETGLSYDNPSIPWGRMIRGFEMLEGKRID